MGSTRSPFWTRPAGPRKLPPRTQATAAGLLSRCWCPRRSHPARRLSSGRRPPLSAPVPRPGRSGIARQIARRTCALEAQRRVPARAGSGLQLDPLRSMRAGPLLLCLRCFAWGRRCMRIYRAAAPRCLSTLATPRIRGAFHPRRANRPGQHRESQAYECGARGCERPQVA
jgi:hypothetical protein